jgi:hypothetical protein
MAQWLLAGQSLLIIEDSRSDSDTPHSAGFLSAGDYPTPRILHENVEHSQDTDIQAPGGIRTRNPILIHLLSTLCILGTDIATE